MMKRIGVFLSARENLPEAYLKAAKEVGCWIGRTGRQLVYGGAAKGQMERLAQTVKAHGGTVIGVIPQVIKDRGLISEQCDITFFTADLSDRKAVMMRESEVLIALPGGIGTLDELFTALAARTLGLYDRPVVLYNAGGCWDSLLDTLNRLHREGLVDSPADKLVHIATDIADLEQFCH
ncbi:MAG: TIGR00730 family Rossman fold protein [Alloprevotella sp.]|nr:TIGR00730 family Rossman fold protein [Alloprevotella sp.]